MTEAKERAEGVLYIVGTPIGNLEDITLRALRVLSEADLVAAEDTRRTLRLLNHYNISKPLIRYDEHTRTTTGASIIRMLKEGKRIALVSESGMPGISDPGYHLVRSALGEGIAVMPVPGPTALVASLAASGLPTDSFVFIGFPPVKRGKRIKRLEELAGQERTIVIYESPRRVIRLLEEVAEVMGNREVVMAREITKLHEEFIRGSVHEVLAALRGKKIKGEITLLISKS